MLLLVNALQSKNFDSRVVQKNVDRGIVSESDFQKHLQSLPDDSENADWSSMEDVDLIQAEKRS